jgi:hypothetical protein
MIGTGVCVGDKSIFIDDGYCLFEKYAQRRQKINVAIPKV